MRNPTNLLVLIGAFHAKEMENQWTTLFYMSINFGALAQTLQSNNKGFESAKSIKDMKIVSFRGLRSSIRRMTLWKIACWQEEKH